MMKKGDLIQQRKDIPAGKALMLGYETKLLAEQARTNVRNYYSLPQSAVVGCVEELGCWVVKALEDTYITIDARVNWCVDEEAGVTFLDTGGMQVLNFALEENKGWVVIESAKPQFQSGVEHMSDEELRASIEALRGKRVARPLVVKTSKVRIKEPPMSIEDKKTTVVLSKMAPEAKAALMRKLGLV